MQKISVLIVLLLVLLTVDALAISETEYSKYSPSELFKISWDSPSKTEKTLIRAYLSENHTGSPEGAYAKVWLAEKDGDKQSEDKGYTDFVKKYPDFLPGLFALSFDVDSLDKIRLLRRILDIDPSFHNYVALRNIYYEYRDDLKDQNAADEFLNKWKRRLGSEQYIFDFIRGVDQSFYKKNYPKAAEYYERALEKQGGFLVFEVWERLVDLKMGKLFDPLTMTEEDRQRNLRYFDVAVKMFQGSSLTEVQKAQLIHKAYKYKADKLKKLDYWKSASYYKKALEAYFSADTLNDAAAVMPENKVFGIMNTAIKDHPSNELLLYLFGKYYSLKEEYEIAEKYYKLAIAKSLIDKDRWVNTREYCESVLVPQKKYDAAIGLLRPFLETNIGNEKVVKVINKISELAGHKKQESITPAPVIEPKIVNNLNHSQLWFFGVGVSNYEQTQQNLKFASKDVEAVGRLLKQQEGKLFQKVNLMTLLDEDATEKSVRVNMNRFLKKASTQDVIVIFLNGHAVQDEDNNLYFMAYDGNLAEPYTGVDMSLFKSYLQGRPASQNVTLFMDINRTDRFSQPGFSMEKIVEQIAGESGAVVLAASSGKEPSLESAYYGGHGAFTAALVEGLAGKADRETGDANGQVGALELVNYVYQRVPKLTGDKQRPTNPLLVKVRNFPLSRM